VSGRRSAQRHGAPRGRSGGFYDLQEIDRAMHASSPENTDPSYEELRKAFGEADGGAYAACVKRFLTGKFRLIEGELLTERTGDLPDCPFSGAVTLFTRHRSLQEDGAIRGFLDWGRVCPRGDPFRHLNRGLSTYFCERKCCPLPRCRRPERQPNSDCLQDALARFLHNLPHSSSNLVDRVLPAKECFGLDITRVPRSESRSGKAFLALAELRDWLQRSDSPRSKNIPLLPDGRPEKWEVIEAALCDGANLTAGLKAFLRHLYTEFWRQPIMGVKQNRTHLAQRSGYSLSDFLEIPLSLLIVPRARHFYFFYYSLGSLSVRGIDDESRSPAPPSGTLVLFSHLRPGISEAQFWAVHAMMRAAMSSVAAMEHECELATFERQQGERLAYDRAFSFICHDLAGTLVNLRAAPSSSPDLLTCSLFVLRACRRHLAHPREPDTCAWETDEGEPMGRVIERAFGRSSESPDLRVDDASLQHRSVDPRLTAIVVELARNMEKHCCGPERIGRITIEQKDEETAVIRGHSQYHTHGMYRRIRERLGKDAARGVHLVRDFCRDLSTEDWSPSENGSSMWRWVAHAEVGKGRGAVFFESPPLRIRP